MNKKLTTLTLLAFALLLAACSRGGGGEGSTQRARRASTITIKGSDTLVLLAQRLAEDFMKEHPGTAVQVTGGGSGTGIAALINGTTQIATASRPIKDSEKEMVEQRRGQPVVEHPVAQDGIAIYLNEANPVEALTIEQIRKIFVGEIQDWSEVGGPAGKITLYSRENNSGTYAYFKEEVLADQDFAAQAQTLPGTAAVVNAISKDPMAIGYGGIAYSVGIRAVGVKRDEGSEAVAPTLETVTDGSYPISRKLFMYTVGTPEGTLAEFLAFATSPKGQSIATRAGYYPLSQQEQ